MTCECGHYKFTHGGRSGCQVDECGCTTFRSMDRHRTAQSNQNDAAYAEYQARGGSDAMLDAAAERRRREQLPEAVTYSEIVTQRQRQRRNVDEVTADEWANIAAEREWRERQQGHSSRCKGRPGHPGPCADDSRSGSKKTRRTR